LASFGLLPAAEVAVDHGRIARGWMMPFNGMVQKSMVEMGRGGACVPARVAPQGRIHRSSPCTMRDTQTYFWYGNAAARTFGRAHRLRPYHSNICRRSAKVKIKVLMLAELPQMAKQKNWCLRSFRKWQNKEFDACGASANGETRNLMLAELPQIAKQEIWCLRSFRKW